MKHKVAVSPDSTMPQAIICIWPIKKHFLEKQMELAFSCYIYRDVKKYPLIKPLRKHFNLDQFNFDERLKDFKLF